MKESILDYIGFTGELYCELSSRMTDREIADRQVLFATTFNSHLITPQFGQVYSTGADCISITSSFIVLKVGETYL